MSGILLSAIISSPPAGWREVPAVTNIPGTRWFKYRDGLAVIAGLEERGGKRWAHVSCSRQDRLPTWDDLKAVKEIFIGDVMAYQVLPPKADWLNIHPHTLHLWHCLDGDPFPDCFGREE